MKKITKVLAALIVVLTALLQDPTIQHYLADALSAHPSIASIIAALAALAALIHEPRKN